jgi:uncharacterized protein YbaR (Trm112 family)
MSIKELLNILRCPACVERKGGDPGQLDLVADKWFVCRDCERKYPIRNRIPIMLTHTGDQYRNTPVQALQDSGE